MKNKKALKILTLALPIAVLVIGFCFAAVAAESEPSVSIIKKNVSYSDYVKVLFAVDDTNAGGGEVELLYYLEDPIANPNAEAKVGEVYNKGYTDENGNNYPAFYSTGFSAKEIDEQVYARAHIVGTDVYSEVVRYSVVEYLLERLYVDYPVGNATEDEKGLYEHLLGYGAYAQKVLINGNKNPDDDIENGKFINDYVLVGIEDGTLDGKYDQGIYFVGDTVYPKADGVETWNATVYDLSTGVGTTTEVEGESAYSVTGFTMFTEKVEGPYKPDLTDTAGRINWSDYSTALEYKNTAKLIDYWFPSGTDPQLVEGAPYGVNSTVAKLTTASAGNQDQFYVKTTSKLNNATMYIFETDVMIDPDVNSMYEITFRNNSNIAYTAFVYADVGGAVTISGKVKADNNTAPISAVTAEGLVGNWFRFRMEYIDVTDTTAKIKFYYNENQIGESEEFTKTYAVSDLNQVIIAANTTAVGDMYIDNTKVAEYTPPYIPDMSDLASRETYEDGDALNLFIWNAWINNSNAGLPTVDATPYGTSSKVAFFAKSGERYEEVGFEQKTIPSETTIYRFETDMMFSDLTGYIKCDLRTSGQVITFSFSISGDTIYLNSGHGTSNNIAAVASLGEWFRFTTECFTDDSGNNLVRFFVNEKQVGTTYACSGAPNAIQRIRFYNDPNHAANIYFDNTRVEFVIPGEEEFIYNSETQVTLVYDSSAVSQTVVNKLADSLKQYVAGVTLSSDGTTSQADHEIIVGAVNNRALSTEAYSLIGTSEAGNVGYCIYSDGTSVAIAFDEAFYGYNIARDAAIEDFLDNYVTSDNLKLEAGVVVDKEIDAIEYQRGVDEASTNASWAELEESLTEKYGSESAAAIAQALKELYTLYSGDMVDWFANLYDPEIGGFYYSMSARDNLGFLPDLESTYQTLGFIATSGMIEGSIKDFIPEDMQNQIVAFTRGLQDQTSGYFYHPQWTKADTDAHPERRGRDVSNAVRILSYFGKLPLYDAPDGTKGEGSVVATASMLTRRLSTSTVSAVSMVTYTSSEEGVPDYLLNDVNFSAYLAQYDETIKTEAYWVGNLLESMATQIVQRDKVLAERGENYSLAKIATDWLTSHQDSETGLWETYEGQEYDCVNGILKISSAYNKMGYAVPNGLKLLDYAIDAITSTADPHHVCCVLNTWYAISVLTTNISTFSETAEEDIAAIRDACISNYPEMIRATKEKYALFVKNEGSSKGGFSYFQNKTSNTSQGMKVALSNVNEADVNATYICSSGTIGHIFGFLGVQQVDILTPADGLSFLMTVDSLEPVVKNTEIPPEPIDFENVTVEELDNDGVIDISISGGELVVENGFPYGESSNVMKLSTVSGGQDLFQLGITKSQGAFNSVAFESDVMFDPDSSSDFDFLMFGNPSTVRHVQVLLTAEKNGGVYISGADFGKTKIANRGSWFNLRVEYSKLNSTTLQVEVYVNDVLRATCKTPYGTEALDASTLTRIQFMGHSDSVCDVYFDNMFLEQFTKDLSTASN